LLARRFPSLRAGRRRIDVSDVVLRDRETFESLLKRFTRKVQRDGVLSEARRRFCFESPSVKRRRKSAARRRKDSGG